MTFIEATRQNIVPLPAGAQAFSSGQPVSATLPRAGYGARVFVHVNGTMTITPGTGSAALAATGPFSLLARIGVLVNAATDILSLSGYGCMCVDKVIPDADGAPALDSAAPGFGVSRAYNTSLFQAGVSSGANTWDFNLVLPIAINFQDPIGLLLLQSPETTAELRLTWNTEGSANTNWPNTPVTLTGNATSAFAGNAFVDVEFFEVPARAEDRPDIRFLHTLTESRMQMTSAGDNFVPLPRGNTYLRLMHNVYANAALDTVDLNKLELSWNQTTKPYSIRRQTQLLLQRLRYGQDLPVGNLVHDWFTTRTTRDVIHTQAITDLMSNVSMLSTTALGSNNNFIDTIAEQLVQIAA